MKNVSAPSTNSSNSASSSQTSNNFNAPKFFVDHKKGEVAELMNLLRNPNIDKDLNKKKDIIKRVIAYMTLGVDVSKLFHEMVKVTNIKIL
jgi:AP-4 complex subunit beta-1